MPISADLLLDTSAAVSLVLPAHDHHEEAVRATSGQRLGLAGHAVVETFSVLTRLPPAWRLTHSDALRLIRTDFPFSVTLRMSAQEALDHAVRAGASGGQVYDVLVGLAAVEAGLPLLSFDARAVRLYRLIGVPLI